MLRSRVANHDAHDAARRVCDIDHRDCERSRSLLAARSASRVRAARFVQGFVRGDGQARLDTLLAERGLFPSRSRAAASVMAGEVRVGRGRAPRGQAGRAGRRRGARAASTERRRSSRAAGSSSPTRSTPAAWTVHGQARARRGRLDGRLHRLPAAARRPRGDRRGRRLRDARLAPAQRPARVGAGAHQRARADARDAAGAAAGADAPGPGDVDVSFISLGKVLGAVLGCLAARYDVLALVKPQFEVGRGRVGKGGVVRDAGDRREALLGVGEAALELGRGGARLPLLGAARAEGQPRDVHVAGRPRAGRDRGPRELAGARARWRGEVEP